MSGKRPIDTIIEGEQHRRELAAFNRLSASIEILGEHHGRLADAAEKMASAFEELGALLVAGGLEDLAGPPEPEPEPS